MTRPRRGRPAVIRAPGRAVLRSRFARSPADPRARSPGWSPSPTTCSSSTWRAAPGTPAETAAPAGPSKWWGSTSRSTLLELGAARLEDAGHHERPAPGRKRRGAAVRGRLVRPGVLPERAPPHGEPATGRRRDGAHVPTRAAASCSPTCSRRPPMNATSSTVSTNGSTRRTFGRSSRRSSELLPDTLTLTYGETTTGRLPIDIAFTDQSDVETVLAALRAELDGGDRTGFDPQPKRTASSSCRSEPASCTARATDSGDRAGAAIGATRPVEGRLPAAALVGRPRDSGGSRCRRGGCTGSASRRTRSCSTRSPSRPAPTSRG